MQSEKARLRLELRPDGDSPQDPGGDWGKAAEKLRRLPVYKSARIIMASPALALRQVRINILADRKRLVMPTAGVQKGFVRVDPEGIPLAKRVFAAQMDPRNPFAAKIPYGKPLKHPIDLILTEALGVAEDGSRIGEGEGHLDLQYAILLSMGWLSPTVQIAAVVEEQQIHPTALPMEPTDVAVHWIVTPQRAFQTSLTGTPAPDILWERLSPKQVRRNDALFFLNRNRGHAPAGADI